MRYGKEQFRFYYFVGAACLVISIIVVVALLRGTTTEVQSSILPNDKSKGAYVAEKKGDLAEGLWHAPDTAMILDRREKELVLYGKDLVVHTSTYLGPVGSVRQITNGMNCQNCHLDAGTRPLGNNYSAVFATYPKFRARSGTTESIIKRIADCFQRSLNGTSPDSSSREMMAMVAYMKFLGQGLPHGIKPNGAGIPRIHYLDRAAEPAKGLAVYQTKCSSCHGAKGQGMMNPDGKSFIYPPMWGANSYSDAAGLYRISNFAGFVKNNMPFGASYEHPLLTDEEAWDVAAFVDSMPRPHKDQSRDWSDISHKPVDFPFGPYQDTFSEAQHKFGPFQPIADVYAREKRK